LVNNAFHGDCCRKCLKSNYGVWHLSILV
jgi:hypothetical protein